MKVYQAINAVQRALCAEGIAKDRRNQQQGYSFRGIDDMYNVVSPLLGKHGLCILPRVIGRTCVERVNAKGTALFYVTCEVEYDLVAAEDGSKHTIRTVGEAMDSGDKATNKALSAAYKYAVMQAFAIPTEGDNDADATTHEVCSAAAEGMTDRAMADWRAAITGAATVDEAREITRSAMAAAKEARDAEAFSALRTAGQRRAEQIAQEVPA